MTKHGWWTADSDRYNFVVLSVFSWADSDGIPGSNVDGIIRVQLYPIATFKIGFARVHLKFRELLYLIPYMRHSVFSDKELWCSDVRILEKLDREESDWMVWYTKNMYIYTYIYYPKQMQGEQFAL